MSKNKHKWFWLSTAAISGLSFLNHYVNKTATHKNLLNPDAGNYYDWKLGKIYYQKEGKGSKPLLLIHDANECASAYEWSLLVKSFRKDYTIYSIDLLGCGRSDKPGITYTNYLYVQLLSDFIREVIGGPVHVIAEGMSSSFAVMTAKCEPALITQIIMLNPPSLKKLSQTPNEKSVYLRTLLSIPIIGTCVYNITVCRSNIDYLLDEKYYFNPFKVQKRTSNAFYEAAHRGNGFGRFMLASRVGNYMNWDIRKALTEIDQPITILYSEKVHGYAEIAASYRKLNNDIRIKSIPNSMNLPQMEVPDQMLAILLGK